MFRCDLEEPSLLSFIDEPETSRGAGAAGIAEMSNSSSKPLNRLVMGARVRLVGGCEIAGLAKLDSSCCEVAPFGTEAVESQHG